MGNCLNGGNNFKSLVQEDQEVKKDYNKKDMKVKIVLRRDELEKLILFQLNVDGKGETTLASFGDFLKELEADRSAGKPQQRWRKKRKSLAGEVENGDRRLTESLNGLKKHLRNHFLNPF